MKYVGRRVVRGKIDSDDVGTTRISMFDGRYDTGYMVTSFRVTPGGWASDAADCFGILSTIEDDSLNAFNPDFSVSTQIAWAGMSTFVSEELQTPFEQVVRDHLLVEDLYIAVRGDIGTNYIIEVDLYELEPFQGSLAVVQNME